MSKLKTIIQCQVHLSILFDEHPYMFNHPLNEIQSELKQRFQWDYDTSTIEEAKIRLEFNIPEDSIIEPEEDY